SLEHHVQEIIESHSANGTIEVAQRARLNELITCLANAVQPDDGPVATRSTVTLPPQDTSTLQLPTQEKKNKLVYLLEDDPLMANDLTIQLEHFSYEVRVIDGYDQLATVVSEMLPVV